MLYRIVLTKSFPVIRPAQWAVRSSSALVLSIDSLYCFVVILHYFIEPLYHITLLNPNGLLSYSNYTFPLKNRNLNYIGNCSIFNKYGHCSLDHPKNVHVVISPPVRCSVCTIPWPCNHCSYTADRKALMAAIAEVHARITRARQINVPDPPRSLTRHLKVSAAHC